MGGGKVARGSQEGQPVPSFEAGGHVRSTGSEALAVTGSEGD
jgi:hypothetical protein